MFIDQLFPFKALALLLAHILSWLAVGHALLTKKDPRSALGWIVTALFLPGIGALLYITFGIRRSESHAAHLMRRASLHIQQPHSPVLHGGEDAETPPGYVPESNISQHFHHLAHLGHVLTGRYLSGGNAITPLFNGDNAYPAMLAAIDNAEKHVFLTTYIFRGGTTGAEFCAALQDAAQRGVDVRVLVDGVGASFYSLSRPWRALPRYGVKLARFLPPKLIPPSLSINLRNHRKVLVCDTHGFTGGMNIADYHTPTSQKYRVQDIHFACAGPIVAQLQEAFLLDWGFCTGEYTTPPLLGDIMCGDALCRMVLDGPGSGSDPLHDLLCGVLTGARKSIRIMTPYFLPTHEMMICLRTAALRGVDVCVILPAQNNLPYVHWATIHLLPSLLEAGVKIFYQPPPFAHTKLLVIDGFYTQIGSANLDPRSLRLNFELNVEIFDTAFARKMSEFFDTKQQQSKAITLTQLRHMSVVRRLRNAACWVFSPYL